MDHARNTLRGRVAAARRGGGHTKPAYGYDRVYYDEAGKVAKRVPYGQKFTKPRGWTMRLDVSEDTQAVATANPNGQTAEARAERAVDELKRLDTHLRAADPMKVRAVIKAIIDNITLYWARDGRCWRFTRGLLTLCDPPGALEGSL